MKRRFVVVAEDALGAALTRDLCDRVVAERSGAEWLRDLWSDEALRDEQRTWTALEASAARPWSSRSDIKRLAGELSIRTHGMRVSAEGAMAHKAVAVAAKLAVTTGDAPDALFLVHDTDGEAEVAERMREGARSREGASPGFPVLVAAPHPESEAWVIAGFSPRTEEERKRHEEERARLGFDPVTAAERLTSGRSIGKKDAKTTCAALLAVEHVEIGEPRVEACWREAPLSDLEANGRESGLARYLRDLADEIPPLLGDTPAR